jgi:hypothetical protein
LLIRHVRAAEKFAAVGGGHDLELMRLGKIPPWPAIGIDDAFGQKVQHPLSPASWHIGSEKVIEASIFADDNDHVFDGGGSLDRIDRCIRVAPGSRWCNKAKNRHSECQRAGSNFLK